MKMAFTKNISNMSQGLPNPGFRSVKVQTEHFLKKDSQHFKNYFQLWFLAKLKGVLSLDIQNCKKAVCTECVVLCMQGNWDLN